MRVLLVLFVAIQFAGLSQVNSVQEKLTSALENNNPVSYNLFNVITAAEANIDADKALPNAQYLELNKANASALFSSSPELIHIDLPMKSGDILSITLQKYDIFQGKQYETTIGGFDAPGTYAAPKPGVHYRGMVDGTNFWASLSVHEHTVAGIITAANTNWQLTQLKNSDTYALYPDADLEFPEFNCGYTDSGESIPSLEETTSKKQTCPIRVLWIGDFQLLVAHYNPFITAQQQYWNTIATIEDIFNNVSLLYQQEGVALTLGYHDCFVQQDEYANYTIPQAFIEWGYDIHLNPSFSPYLNGHDLSLLLGVQPNPTLSNIGGYAVIDALCDWNYYYNPVLGPDYAQGKYAYTRNPPSHEQYPVFSFTIYTVAHEMGHNLGSRHTHWCGWPGGPIDNCVPVEEGPCSPGPNPSNGGTVMSYCGITYGSIPLSNGFANYPHQAIINTIDASETCICSGVGIEELESTSDIFEIVPNPSQGSFVVNGANGVPTLLDDVVIVNVNGQVVRTIEHATTINTDSMESGVYFISFNSENATVTLKLVVR